MARMLEEQEGPRQGHPAARLGIYLDAETEDLIAQARTAGLDVSISAAARQGIRRAIRQAARKGISKPGPSAEDRERAIAEILGA